MANEYIVGQVITLSDSVANGSGVATDDSTESVLVYKPDGTTDAPSVSHGATGQYTATYVPDQPGWHEYVFASSGAAAGRARGRFWVQPVP